MTTIAKMVVAFDGDNRALKRTFSDSRRDLRQFADAVVVSSGQMQRAMRMFNGDLQKAQSFITSMNNMVIAAHQRRDRELSKSIASLDPFLNQAGFLHGQTYARAVSAGFAQGNAIGNIRRVLSGATLGGGIGGLLTTGRMGRVLGSSRFMTGAIAGLFTLANLGDAFGSGETKLTRLSQGLSAVLKTVSSISLFFGPKGLIVAGITAATSFVVDFFAKTRDEAARTTRQLAEEAKRMQEQVRSLIDTRDPSLVLGRLQELDIGRASAGGSSALSHAFEGGIADLQARIRIQEQHLATANKTMAAGLRRTIADLRAQLEPLLRERAELMRAVMDPTAVREVRGAAPITITAAAPGFEFAELQRMGERVLRLHRTLTEAGTPAVNNARRLGELYLDLGRALESIRNPWDEQALSIRTLRAEIERMVPILSRAGALPEVSVIGRDPLRPKPPRIAPITGPIVPNISGESGASLLNAGGGIPPWVVTLIEDEKRKAAMQREAAKFHVAQYGFGLAGRGFGPFGGMIQGVGTSLAMGNLPMAAAAGITGLVEGIFGLGDASRRTAKAIRELIESTEAFLDQMKVDLGILSQADVTRRDRQRTIDEHRSRIQAQIRNYEFAERRGWLNDEGNAILAQLRQQLADWNIFGPRWIDAIEEHTDALRLAVRNAPSGFFVERYFDPARLAGGGSQSMLPPSVGMPSGEQGPVFHIQIPEGGIVIDGNRSPHEMARDLIRALRSYGNAIGGPNMPAGDAMDLLPS